MKATLYTDGGARGNPGPAACGIILLNEKKQPLAIDAKYLGNGTNNQAEYEALILGLKHARKMNVDEIECYLDSELAVKQLNEIYKTKNKHIIPLKKKVVQLADEFKKVSYYHVEREFNKFADKLVNIVLDNRV
jgi:ribonuclease HI